MFFSFQSAVILRCSGWGTFSLLPQHQDKIALYQKQQTRLLFLAMGYDNEEQAFPADFGRNQGRGCFRDFCLGQICG
jgi:hypothetical protein